MFLKQYNYKPRQGSQSGQPDNAAAQQQQQQAPASTAQPAGSNSPTLTAAQAGRRRSSVDGGKFAGLQGYKRSSMDGKREGFAEQSSAQSGVLGQMWTNFTKGK